VVELGCLGFHPYHPHSLLLELFRSSLLGCVFHVRCLDLHLEELLCRNLAVETLLLARMILGYRREPSAFLIPRWIRTLVEEPSFLA